MASMTPCRSIRSARGAGLVWLHVSRPVRPPGRGPTGGPRSGSDTVADGLQAPVRRPRATPPRRSARRRIVRATSSAALSAVSPGTTNSWGMTICASSSRSCVSIAETIAAETRVRPSTWRSQASGFVASSAAATNRSRWMPRMIAPTRADGAVGLGVLGGGPGDAERGDGLIDRAVGLGPKVVLADALAAEQESGRAGVALAGRDRGVEAGARRAGGGRIAEAVRPVGHRGVTTSGPRRADPSARRAGSP